MPDTRHPLAPHRPTTGADPVGPVYCERDGQPWPCAAAMVGGPKHAKASEQGESRG